MPADFLKTTDFAEHVRRVSVNVDMLVARHRRFKQISPLNELEWLVYFDAIIVQIRALCLESRKRKDERTNYTVQSLMKKMGRDDLSERLNELLDERIFCDSEMMITEYDITIGKAIKFIADKFVCHYEVADKKRVAIGGILERNLCAARANGNFPQVIEKIVHILKEAFEGFRKDMGAHLISMPIKS